jgi:4-aminobutyrate aminotransferase-like enzyme/Ser/Thr protein kinase RdoA (MazF antagonist)
LYGLQVTASPLPSERDQNFLLETGNNEKFVLKIANALEERALLEAQNAALAHVACLSLCPSVVPSINGAEITEVLASSGATNQVRLLTYLPGTPLAEIASPERETIWEIGVRLAQLDKALATFEHPACHRDFHWDLANGLQIVRTQAPSIPDESLRVLLQKIMGRIEPELQPILPGLRRSTIHNDANDYNVLIKSGERSAQVAGFLDFGDMVHSYTVADLAIATAYAILNKPEPLVTAAELIAGYNTELKLAEVELKALFPLVCLRLCLSVCHAAQQQQQRPDDSYLGISQQAIAQTLPELASIEPIAAEAVFRSACSFGSRLPPTKRETLEGRRKLLGPSLSIAYDEPLKIIRGSMQYLYDDQGRKYLDAYNNVPHVGHCHPRVVKAGQDQMALLNTNTRYVHDLVNQFAERLAATLPDPLSVCFFVNSGSEANELAIRLARAHTRRRDLIVLEDAYHGNTNTLIDISPYKHNGPGGEGPPSWVHTAPRPDAYRGPFKVEDPQAGEKYAQQVVEMVDRLCQTGKPPAGFIAESWPSVGGQMSLPATYLPVVYKAVRTAGGVCIADEVQTAYGRLGEWFWGFQPYDVVPDIVVLGKPIGNGHPLGAVITTAEIANSFANGMEFFSTFGGNTVSCAIGLAVLDVMVEEDLQEHALQVGKHLFRGLLNLFSRHELVGHVRGSGLFLGVELVRDRKTLEPAATEASLIVNRLREEGILVGTDGPFHNVIKIRPPMPFSLEDADLLVGTLDRVLFEI